MSAKHLYSISHAREQYGKHLSVGVNEQSLEKMDGLVALLQKYPGQLPVVLNYKNASAQASIACANSLAVLPSDELFQDLRKIFPDNPPLIIY